MTKSGREAVRETAKSKSAEVKAAHKSSRSSAARSGVAHSSIAARAPEQIAPRARGATRARLLDAALQLFAEQGFDGTAVRDLEEAAGLAAGRGSFYRHFESKEAVLAAVLARETTRLEQLRDLRQRAVRGTLGDLRAETLLEFRLVLGALDETRYLLNILARESGRFPDLMEQLSSQLIDESRELHAQNFLEGINNGAIKVTDAQALTAVIESALIGYHLTKTYFGKPPAGIDQERFIGALANLMFGE